MGKKEIINFWNKSSRRDLKTAQGLFELKRYDACLFFCHLSLEKLLKGLIVKITEKPSPYIHDLDRLAYLAQLDLSEKQSENLKIITDFNIAGRYNDEKSEFYKKCTKKYTEKYLNITKELFLWLKKEYRKK